MACEAAVAAELEKLLAECPDVEEHVTEDQETARALNLPRSTVHARQKKALELLKLDLT